MFYFTCNESRIYESFTFWNNLQSKKIIFHDIPFFLDAPVYIYMYMYIYVCICQIGWQQYFQCANISVCIREHEWEFFI